MYSSIIISTFDQKAEATKQLEKFLKQIKPDRIDTVYYRVKGYAKGYDETVTVAFADREPIEVCVNLDSVEALVMDVLNAVIYK